jgi:hypothetical protein
MRSILLQDWTTVRGVGNTTTITQSEADWLDLEPYSDVVIWVEVAEATGTPYVLFDTAPVAIEALFQTIDFVPGIASATPVIRKVFANVVQGFPLARFLRWRVLSQSAGTEQLTT